MVPPTESNGVPSGVQLGRYEVLGEIASGGMATVFLGRVAGAKGFQRLVAIKRLHPHLANEEDFVAMFLDEARLAARIRHANVVATLEVADQDGLYLVMEYIEGDRLLGLLRHAAQATERIPPTVGLRIALDTLAGLQAAHELTDDDGQLLGLVHRDVSPQNILVGLDGIARLTDFGIAKATARLTVTRDGQLKGKIAYMAPEQTRRVEIDRRVDVFAMGIITWEMLTSKKLFTGESDVEVLNQLLFEPIPRLKDHAPGLPAGLDTAVMKALERDPVKRYSSAAEFADALERASRVFGGPANARTVAAYVQKVAGDRLAHDRARINAGGVPAPRVRASAPGFGSTMTPSGVQRLPADRSDAADPPHETLASYDGPVAKSSPPPPLASRPSSPGVARPALPRSTGPAVRARAPTLQGMAVPTIPGVTTSASRPAPRPVATSTPPAAPKPSTPPAVRADVSLIDDDEDAPTHAYGPPPVMDPPASMPPLPTATRVHAPTGSMPAVVAAKPASEAAPPSSFVPIAPVVEAPPEPRRPSMTATQKLNVVAVYAPAIAPRAASVQPAATAGTARQGERAEPVPANAPARGLPFAWIAFGVVCLFGVSVGAGWQFRRARSAPPRAEHHALAHAAPPPAPSAVVLVADAAIAVAPPSVPEQPAVAIVADAAIAAPVVVPIAPAEPAHPNHPVVATAAAVSAAASPTASATATSAPHAHPHPTAPAAPVAPHVDVAPDTHAAAAAPHPAPHPAPAHPAATEDDPFGSSNPYSR